MIGQIKGILVKKTVEKLTLEVGNIGYEIFVPKTVSSRLADDPGSEICLTIYHYFHMEKNRYIPVLIGFLDEMEKDFFEIFIGVSGIGPKAALRALDKPVSKIARAIEEEDTVFLTGLAGIGRQKAKQIIAQLGGKVGRFALLPQAERELPPVCDAEIIEEARHILRRLQYSAKEIDVMIKQALSKEEHIDTVENLLNEIYKARV